MPTAPSRQTHLFEVLSELDSRSSRQQCEYNTVNLVTIADNFRYHNLGVAWASSTLAFITAAMFPVPILFYYYGDKIRKMSRYVPDV
jgi:hypothetical protein